jgi:hypothetical protein
MTARSDRAVNVYASAWRTSRVHATSLASGGTASRPTGQRSEALEPSEEGVTARQFCRSIANWGARDGSMTSHVGPVRPARLPTHGTCGRSRPVMDYRTESLDSESAQRSRFLASDDRVCSIVLDSGSRPTSKRSLDDPPSVIPPSG